MSLREDGYPDHEERAPEEPWLRRVLLRGVALFLAWMCLLMIVLYPLSLVSFAGGPCQQEGWEKQSALWLMWASFPVGAFLLFRAAKHRSARRFWTAIALLALMQGWNAYAKWVDAGAQRQCSLRTVDEAMAWCRADPAVYSKSVSTHGYPLLTLVAPGTTDRAWSCLMSWQEHQAREPAWSVLVDESIYGPRR